DFDVLLRKNCGDFHANETASDHDRSFRLFRTAPNGFGVVHRPQVVQVLKVRTWNVEPSRTCTGRHNQLVECKFSPSFKVKPLPFWIYPGDFAFQLELDSMRTIEVCWTDSDGVFGFLSQQKALGQRRPFVWDRSIGGKNRQLPGVQSALN